MFELSDPVSVVVEGLRDPIYLRGWPLGKLLSMYECIERISEPKTQASAVRTMLAGSLCRPDGEELSVGDIEALNSVPLPVCMRIAQEVLKVNGLTSGAVEAAKKNSADPNSEPSSSSPPPSV
jgi:hypothetical protein